MEDEVGSWPDEKRIDIIGANGPTGCHYEEWREIEEFGGRYEVSSLGRVRSTDRLVQHSDGKTTNHKSRLLKQGLSHKGYPTVWPTVDGKKHSRAVHRLVATTFIDNPECLPQVNHINEIRDDNRVENLEWCMGSYNVAYSQSASAFFMSPEGELVLVNNFSEFSRENGLSNGKLSALRKGERIRHKGWSYVGEVNEETRTILPCS